MLFGYHPKDEAAEAEGFVDCPNCGAPVLAESAHMESADWINPGYWTCNPLGEDDAQDDDA